MNLFEFLRKLEAFYPLNESQEKVDNRLSSYVDILEGEIVKRGKKYDYSKVLKHIQMNYRYKTFPSLPDLLDFLNIGEVRESINCKDEGCLVVIRLPESKVYAFEVAPFCRDLEDLKKDAASRFGNSKIEIYPKGSVLIGDTVITP
jgi:hypothetical protein